MKGTARVGRGFKSSIARTQEVKVGYDVKGNVEVLQVWLCLEIHCGPGKVVASQCIRYTLGT